MTTQYAATIDRRAEERIAALLTFPLRFAIFAATWIAHSGRGRKVALALAHSRVGRVWERRGRLNKAMARYRRALQINPDCIESLRNLGRVLIAKRKFRDAVIHLEEVLTIDPDDGEALATIDHLSAESGVSGKG